MNGLTQLSLIIQVSIRYIVINSMISIKCFNSVVLQRALFTKIVLLIIIWRFLLNKIKFHSPRRIRIQSDIIFDSFFGFFDNNFLGFGLFFDIFKIILRFINNWIILQILGNTDFHRIILQLDLLRIREIRG